MQRLQLGVLGSGKGSNFVALQQAIAEGRLSADIRVVISDIETAPILDHAREFGLPAFALRKGRFRTKLEPEIEQELVDILRRHGCEWVILAGYMRVVKAPLLEAFPERIINIHPSLLPKYKGLEAWRQALEAGETEAGCTVHLVTPGVDEGPVLSQARVPVLPDDTAESLHQRIHQAEHKLFAATLQRIAAEPDRNFAAEPLLM
ncbi:MAG: phosphoribosylglycinamide formyltransferase [Candidatus Methylacidiphilales bacterium]|nr:phosphoribosylglycinamide formyltransferase [Candidatus Methylacidiphilales bacterium]